MVGENNDLMRLKLLIQVLIVYLLNKYVLLWYLYLILKIIYSGYALLEYHKGCLVVQYIDIHEASQ